MGTSELLITLSRFVTMSAFHITHNHFIHCSFKNIDYSSFQAENQDFNLIVTLQI